MVKAVRLLTIVQHLLVVALLVVGVGRALATGASGPPLFVAAAAFAGWYAIGAREFAPDPLAVPARRGRWWLAGLLGCWLTLVAVSAENVWIAFPLWLMVGHLLPLRPAIAVSAAVLLVVVLRPTLGAGILTPAGIVGPVIGAVFALAAASGQRQLVRDAVHRQRLVDSLVRAQRETAELHDELAALQREAGMLAERTRLSRDLHDTIAQSFTSIVLLARAATRAGDPATTAELLAHIDATAGTGLAEVREVVGALAPTDAGTGGLAGSLRRLVEALATQTGIDASFELAGDPLGLPTAVDVALLRVAQGALANVRRHAHATRVSVTLTCAPGEVRLRIADDGRGFAADRWPGQAPVGAAGGYGLRSSRDRMRELGGDLTVRSAPGEGTVVTAHVPLFPPAPAPADRQEGMP